MESSKLIPTSSKLIGENSYLTGNITKHSFRNGKLVTEHIRSDELIPGGEFASVKSIRYEYADEPRLANNYVRREEELRNLGIRELSNKADFITTNNQWVYETKEATRR